LLNQQKLQHLMIMAEVTNMIPQAAAPHWHQLHWPGNPPAGRSLEVCADN
jgi:hypothetical protein